MALSLAVRQAILAEIAANGIDSVTAAIRDSYVTAKVGSAITGLEAAVKMQIADWTTLEAFLTAGVSSTALYPIRDAISDKIAARDETGLGILLLTFYASDKAHRG